MPVSNPSWQPAPAPVLLEPGLPQAQPLHHTWRVIIAIVAVLGALVGVGAWSAYGYYTSTPEYVTERLATAWPAVTTYHYVGSMTASSTGGDGSTVQNFLNNQTGEIVFTGDVDRTDPVAVKFSSEATLTVSLLKAALLLRGAGEDLYLKIDDIPVLSSLTPPLKEFFGQWFRLNWPSVRDNVPVSQTALPTAYQESGSELSRLGDADVRQQLEDILDFRQFIVLGDKIGSEQLGEIKTNHYTFTLDIDQLYQAALQVVALLGKTDQVGAAAQADLRQSLTQWQEMRGDIWIGAADYLPYRWTLAGTFTQETQTIAIQYAMQLNNFNQPVTITIPTDAINLMDKLTALTSAVPQTPDTDGDGLSNQQETFYRTDSANPDSDGDGYTDGEEVKNGYNPNGAGALLPSASVQ